MAKDLKEELGEIKGLLSSLGPELERIEGRERASATTMAALGENVKGLRRDLDELIRKISSRLRDIYSRLGSLETSGSTRAGTVEARLKGLEDKDDGMSKKIWDVAKIILTAGIAAAVTHYVGKK